ncbi:MAG TPA: enoyl-CoA hydratase/isomerase family protein, partial [Acidimicrobiia bacterium]|nr:enoyl-CoA hydratase/isomerase family protein [Acidimicrobiia bacterium]
MDHSLILIDDPAPKVRRITLNRPEKRNALNATLRREILTATREADRDDDVSVTIIRGAGKCFSAGYDLSGDPAAQGEPLDYNAEGEGSYMRGVTNGWMSIWDLAKPVIAQVHGYCLAGGSEMATGCDLVYVAEDAQIGYPAVRFGVPDMHFHAW